MKINHLAVIVAGVAYFAFGAIWYTVFGAAWKSFVGNVPDQGYTPYVVSLVMAVVLAYIAAVALAESSHPQPVRHGIEFGLFMGAGIFATNLLVESFFEGRSLGLWAINASYVVIGLAIIGAIVGGWRKRAIS